MLCFTQSFGDFLVKFLVCDHCSNTLVFMLITCIYLFIYCDLVLKSKIKEETML